MIEVEKGIEITPNTRARGKYPWHEMEVGDSFFVKDGRQSVIITCSYRIIGKTFETRKVDGGIRCWRTK